MSNFNNIKATINANIKPNGTEAITGAVLQSVLTQIVNALGSGYAYKGRAYTTTDPGSPDAKVFYITTTAGTYTKFGNLVVNSGELAVLKWDIAWTKDSYTLPAGGGDTSSCVHKTGNETINGVKTFSDGAKVGVNFAPVKTLPGIEVLSLGVGEIDRYYPNGKVVYQDSDVYIGYAADMEIFSDFVSFYVKLGDLEVEKVYKSVSGTIVEDTDFFDYFVISGTDTPVDDLLVGGALFSDLVALLNEDSRLSGAVRYDVPQSLQLSDTEKATARQNINAERLWKEKEVNVSTTTHRLEVEISEDYNEFIADVYVVYGVSSANYLWIGQGVNPGGDNTKAIARPQISANAVAFHYVFSAKSIGEYTITSGAYGNGASLATIAMYSAHSWGGKKTGNNLIFTLGNSATPYIGAGSFVKIKYR